MFSKKITLLTLLSGIVSCGSDQAPCNPPSSQYDITEVQLKAATFNELNSDIFAPTVTNEITVQTPINANILMLEVIAETSNILAVQQDKKRSFNFSFMSSAYACSAIPAYTNEVIANFTITSTADFSDDLPANTSLNSVFDVQYNEKLLYKHNSSSDTFTAFNINEFVAQNPQGSKLIQLKLNTLPETDQVHIFTLHYTHTNGEEFIVSSNEITFE